MTTPSKRLKNESSFGSFAFGVAVGVGAALLFATEEGRTFASKLLDSLKDNLPKSPNSVPKRTSAYDLASNPESTPHHTTYTPPASY